MKAIILLLVFSSGLFADTIRYSSAYGDVKKIEGEYLGIYKNRIIIKDENKLVHFSCEKLLSIIDNNNKSIFWNCNINTLDEKYYEDYNSLILKQDSSKVLSAFLAITLIALIALTINPPIAKA